MMELFKYFLIVILVAPWQIFADDGATLYKEKACYACHGEKAQGTEIIGAPALAGQDYAYLKRQLENFKDLKRGYHKDDIYGQMMHPVASSLSPSDIDTLAKYLNKQPPQVLAHTMPGNPVAGKQYFAVCMACHGERAEGNTVLNAPNLQILNDWYIFYQLVNFKAGLRGAQDKDPIGASMAPNAALLPDDKAIQDVVAYIYSLKYK